MECDICARNGKELTDLGVNCASCARTTLYALRLEHGQTLLERGSLGSRIESITLGKGSDKRLENVWTIEADRARASDIRTRLGDGHGSISTVKQEIEDLKAEIQRRKVDLTRRRSTLKTTKGTLAGRDKGETDKFGEKLARGRKNFDAIHAAAVETRAYLCREAANILRLRQGKSRSANQTQSLRYFIGTTPIPDLKSINGVRCSELTAMLASVSRLVCLVSFYLGLRLPAEIILPHRNYPLATINTPATSYATTKPEFPGSGSYLAMTDVSKNSENRGASRSRPLFIGSDDRNELVTDLARKDPSAFKFFVEAVSLLAWDVTWLAHSQGLSTGNETWSEICNLGASLWAIVFATPQSSAVRRALARQSSKQSHDSPRSRSSTPVDAQVNQLGAYSHASAHSSLSAAARMAHMRSMRLSKYTMIADPLRKILENEMKNAEWEVLQEDEIFDGGETFDEAVLIPARHLEASHYDATRSIMSTAPSVDPLNGRPKGTSGWTKVKDTKIRD
ncbi:uncharacterized protein AB675_2538 [Cyphellophora attinorum]|uniref:Autophagy-related protein 14 n=1 Tax=Cyphellophora attinorum TaxID=1664694 RepID=A0A0N1HX08_9EURO|nr:uncharacterized protein AB675_2538 [Phialophora attinorum]KPI44927.1 hypothetical protein AB675_2538 [Phialophora attinorum]